MRLRKWQRRMKKKLLRRDVSAKIKTFFNFLFSKTDIAVPTMKELMNGANIQIDDGGRFYTLMCHDILECERKRKQKCKSCQKKVFNQYYAAVKYGAGSSHKSYKDDDYPQYRMGIGSLVDFKTDDISKIFDFLIGLREINDRIYTWFQFEYARGCCKRNSNKELKELDNLDSATAVWNMSTPGHILSTINYGLTWKNQGPFGESDRNDNNPINLKLTSTTSRNDNFRRIREEDGVQALVLDCKRLKF